MELNNTQLSFDRLPQAVAELTEKVDHLTELVGQLLSSDRTAVFPEIMGFDQAVRMLDLAPSTVYDKVSQGVLPHIKKGNKLYFERDALITWMRTPDAPKPRKKREPVTESVSAEKVTTESNPEPNPVTYEIIPTVHTQTKKPIWVVKFDGVDEATKTELKSRVKDFGGYFTTFNDMGFILNDEAKASAFAGLKARAKGGVDE